MALKSMYKMGVEGEFRYSIPLYIGQFRRAVQKGRKALLREVSEGFSSITQEEPAAINKKWMGSAIPFNPRYLTYLSCIAGVFVALGALLLLWNALLRREVSRKTKEVSDTLTALKKSEKQYRELVENANSAILRVDTNGNITFCNAYARRFFGYEEEGLLGKNLIGTIVPEKDSYGRDLEAMLRDIYRDPENYVENVNENMRRNGERVWVAWNNKPIYDADHNLVEILCIGNDITYRRMVEEERKRLASAIAQVAEAVLITDGGGRIEYVNPSFEVLTGYLHDEVIGSNPRILKSGAHEVDFYRELWNTITGDRTWKGRIVNRKKDGSEYTAEITISPMRNAGGKIANYIAVQRDITESLQLEDQLIQARKMEAVGRLAGGVAHDFNNMLTVILGYSELSLGKLPPTDPMYQSFKAIHDTAGRSAELTRQLLAFSRKQIIAPQVIDLNGQLKSMEQLLRRTIGEDIELVFRLTPDLWPVYLDPSQVDQVLVNLAVNSRDAMPDGGVLTIETENVEFDEQYCHGHLGLAPGQFAMLAVSDNGYGMDEATRANIFEPFFTTKEKGKGTGIGLATVYGIVRQNAGHINIYSELGRGTTVNIYFPRHLDGGEVVAVNGRKSALTSGSETVLVVEDQEMVRDMARKMLERLGYTVFTAIGPEDALRLCETCLEKIDLLLTDVVMPSMNGRELSERILRMRGDIKVVFMSGYTADAIAQHGVMEPGVHFIHKPFSFEKLSDTVRQVLES